MAERVVVAMSGGVDSSVAAALLADQGYDVIGITLNVWPRTTPAVERVDSCCSLAAVEDARRVADRLGIAHYTLNFREAFARCVIADFVEEYRRGRTPNPCIRCNEFIKFESLLHKALELGARYVATGHYVRVETSDVRHLLRKGIDHGKDQSYVLYTLTQEQLAHTLFPLGSLTKVETRRVAQERLLPVAQKPESQEICFVPDNNYGGFLRDYVPGAAVPGPIVDKDGNQLGQHQGIICYTIGQRRGLGLPGPKPWYVVGIDAGENTIVVGHDEDLFADELVAENVNLIAWDKLDAPTKVSAKIRYRAPESPATAIPLDGNRLLVRFDHPQRAITPGQAVVLYQDDVVVGGATIAASGSGAKTRHRAT